MKQFQKIAEERIYRLFELAGNESEKHPERSKRYVQLARLIGTKNRAKIPKELKKKFCKKCGAFLSEGKNAEIKKEGSLLSVKCKECGGTLSAKDITLANGAPMVNCPYCHTIYQLTEEPKW